MKIAFDCSLVPGERAGTGQYAYQLAHALSRVDKDNTYILYVLLPKVLSLLRGKKDLGLPDEGNFSVVTKSIPVPYQFFSYLDFPGMPAGVREFMLGGLDVDVVHTNSFCVPRFRDRRKKVVATIYDVSVVTHPECHKRLNIQHCTNGIKDAVEFADRIIAISEHTKRDIIRYFNAPADLITVTHLAAGPDYYRVTDPEKINAARLKYKLPENYILFLGSAEPRKNIKTLLKAYACLPGTLKKEFALVIAGGRGWMNSDIPGVIKDLKIEDRVVSSGYIDNADISAVYSGAAVFVYPSLYEGFGLPILEAMSCGTPVVTSNTSSMPEVAGDAAMLVTPQDAGDIATALEAVLENTDLREHMRELGLRRSAMFSWEKCARETIEVYGKVVESGKR